MNIIIAIFAALSLSLVSQNIFADTSTAVPPEQMQKDKVPDSTSNGNYLEPQPDENGAIQQNTQDQNKHSKKSKTTKKHSGTKPTNRGKQTTETPEDGGMTLEQK